MKKTTGIALLSLIGMSAACSNNEIGLTHFPAGQVQIVHKADSIKWRPCPPTLPKNCEIAVLEGHPKQANMFTVRFRSSGEMFMPAHTHPKDERVTLLQGKVAVAFGHGAKRKDATEFGPGDFYINARHEIHTVWIEKGSILQITGIGPWKADFVKKQ